MKWDRQRRIIWQAEVERLKWRKKTCHFRNERYEPLRSNFTSTTLNLKQRDWFPIFFLLEVVEQESRQESDNSPSRFGEKCHHHVISINHLIGEAVGLRTMKDL